MGFVHTSYTDFESGRRADPSLPIKQVVNSEIYFCFSLCVSTICS